MRWDLEGSVIEAKYLDEHFVRGKVINSRVAYGGRVRHTIVLLKPIIFYGTMRETLSITHDEVISVK